MSVSGPCLLPTVATRSRSWHFAEMSSAASNVPPFARPPPERHRFGVAIICALPLEATAVLALFEKTWDPRAVGKAPGGTNEYSFGLIAAHHVVVVHMSGPGKVRAATTAADLRTSFPNLGLVLLVGICGGAPYGSKSRSVELQLGDVVVSTGVVQYDLGRRLPGNRFARKDTPHHNLSGLSANAGALLAKLQTEQNTAQLCGSIAQHLKVLQQRLGAAAACPDRTEDILFESDYLHKHHEPSDCSVCAADLQAVCDEAAETGCDQLRCLEQERHRVSLARRNQSFQPAVHFGLFASGDTIMRSGSDRDEIAARDGVVAFEMEGAGLWEIFRSSACLIVKTVCDYADSHKSKSWQPYAAAVAAVTAKALLRTGDQVSKSAGILV